MKDKPFVLIGVNSDELDRAKKAVAENQLNWRSFQNKRSGQPDISDDWAVQGWPTIVVLDAEMKIRYRGHDGEAATETARNLVTALAKPGGR
jgi:hypothetical protein